MTVIVVRRPKDHHKGEKTIAVIPYGKPVPPGVIIGKDSIITVEERGGDVSGIQSKDKGYHDSR